MTDETSTLERVRWLTDSGRELLHTAGPPRGRQSSLPEEPLARLTPWQQELLQQQQQLRWRSRNRFPFPEMWLWTERSLAQASDYWSAHYKAALFPRDVPVMDACCGAGADLVALASRGEVSGIDADPVMAHLAADNARAHGYQVPVATETFDSAWQGKAKWLSIDPDRRPAGRRTTDADEFSPRLTDVLTVIRPARGAIVKLAPSTRLQEEQTAAIEAIGQRLWLGNQGECRQQLLLTGELQQGESRMAVLCEPGQCQPEQWSEGSGAEITAATGNAIVPLHKAPAVTVTQFAGLSELPARTQQVPLRYIYELHNVLHAAQLQSTWANRQPMDAIGDAHGYYTADQLTQSQWAQAFEVIDVLPWDDRQLRKWLRKRGIGKVEIKIRAVGEQARDIDANACQRRYSAPTGEPLTLLVTRLGGRVRGIAARRLSGS